jgi:hypothetical protein
MKFVYLVMSYPEDSAYPFTNHTSDEAPTHIYAVFATMGRAAACVADIYRRQIMGVKTGTEYAVIKRKVSDAEEEVPSASLLKETSMTNSNQQEE